jgi:hypothetical protein
MHKKRGIGARPFAFFSAKITLKAACFEEKTKPG